MRPVRVVPVLVAFMLIVAGHADAQSLFATRGLGYPLQPEDARTRGIGGVAVGLPDFDVTWANPASSVGVDAPTFVFGYQYDNFNGDAGGNVFDGRSARFPLLLGAFPATERIVLQAGFGGFLDQNWVVETEEVLRIAGEDVTVIDRATSEGGVGRFRLGLGYQLSEQFGIAVATDLYTGEIERIQGRIFPFPFNSAPERGVWSYRGLGYTAGAHWSRGADAGAGLAISLGGTLDAETSDPASTGREYDLPLTVRAGASGRVGQNTLLALSGSWAGWSTLDEALADRGGAADSWSVEGGVEWEAITIRDRPIPIRLGARNATLPFGWDQAPSDQATERALSFGFGAVLAGGATRSDFGFEFGNRGGDAMGIDESYWRFNFSVRVLAR